MKFGVIPQKKDLYALRIVGSCGQFTADEIMKIAQLANRFGNGNITATSRGTCEIEGVTEDKLKDAVEYINQQQLRLGGTGATVRAVVACKGSACRRGMFDVHTLACELDKKFSGQSVPKKFKIGVFGCINSLGKAMAQDIGIMPSFAKLGYFEIYVGGLLGKTPKQGKHITVPLTREQLFDAVKFILELYQNKGSYPKRLRTVLDEKPELWNDITAYIKSL